jgi:hypothetical protein
VPISFLSSRMEFLSLLASFMILSSSLSTWKSWAPSPSVYGFFPLLLRCLFTLWSVLVLSLTPHQLLWCQYLLSSS